LRRTGPDFEPRVIGILRGTPAEVFPRIVEAARAGGLRALELTVNTPDAFAMVAELRPRLPESFRLGMGTVRNPEEARRAVEAGAMFLVTPNVDPRVIRLANEARIPIIAGAMTPTEVWTAWQAGADLVKLFPANRFGPGYIRDLRGPFDEVPIVAVGGITPETAAAYFEAGAVAVAATSALFGREALAGPDLGAVTRNVRAFLDRCGGP